MTKTANKVRAGDTILTPSWGHERKVAFVQVFGATSYRNHGEVVFLLDGGGIVWANVDDEIEVL